MYIFVKKKSDKKMNLDKKNVSDIKTSSWKNGIKKSKMQNGIIKVIWL